MKKKKKILFFVSFNVFDHVSILGKIEGIYKAILYKKGVLT